MSELAIPDQPQQGNTLESQMSYARAVSTASMLPENYRGKPADIMLAVGLGSSMGLSPAESLYRISVIKGRPTASAELIAANVRKAGHRLRVHGDETTSTATIIRADDPDYEFTVTRDLAWAERMGLARNDNYRKQSGTMLQWRAITAVARLACPEALYGVAYTADEMEDVGEQRRAASLAQQVGAVTVEQVEPEAQEPLLLNTSSKLARAMYASINEAGIQEAERIDWVSHVIGRDIDSTKEMTEDEARTVLAHLDAAKQSEPTP